MKRFWDKVKKTSTCWLWTAGCTSRHYGSIRIGDKCISAHRFVWELVNGPIPKGLSVLHKCDVKHCVNPSHLFLGTQDDNMKDASNKGRIVSGKTKLTKEEILEIRHSNYSNDILMEAFDVNRSTITRIKVNAIWTNI